MTYKAEEKKNASKFSNFIFQWQFFLMIFTLIMMVIFGGLESRLIQAPPSDNWSVGIEILNDTPNDFREISQVKRHNDEGITMAYIVKQGIKLVELDWLGRVERSSLIEMNSSKLRLLNIQLESDTYQVYVSDRQTLDRLDVDLTSLSLKKESRISSTSKHFDVDGNAIIAGNNAIIEILVEDKVVASFPSDEDLKQVNILQQDGKIYATIDTFQGGTLVMVDGEKVIKKEIISKTEQETYGLLKDIHVSEGLVTVMSSSVSMSAAGASATPLGVWQLDAENLIEKSFRVFYHVKTSLSPEIIDVAGDNITYILGVQQTQDSVNKGIYRYTHVYGGIFTNISKYTREGDGLIDNTRLTVTREYPIGYKYFSSDKGDVLVWLDRINRDQSQYLLTGEGEPWITHGNKVFNLPYLGVITSTILNFGATVFLGTFFLLLYIGLHFKLILGFIAVVFAYFRWHPLDDLKKRKHIFIASILFTAGFKFYIIAISNPDIETYAHIYPMFLGNDLVLMSTSIITSILSVCMIKLWKRQYPYIDSLLSKFFVYIGFEAFFYLYTIGVYIVSAMMRNNFSI